MVDPVYSFAAVLVLFWVLVTAGAHKLLDRPGFRASLSAYELLPAALVPAVALSLPLAELLLAVGLLQSATRAFAALGAAVLLAVYTLAIGINLARGRGAIDCGCGDPARRQPLSGWLLLRNLTLVGLSLLPFLPALRREVGWLDFAVAVLAAVTAGLIYTAGNRLLANRELLSNLKSSHGHA